MLSPVNPGFAALRGETSGPALPGRGTTIVAIAEVRRFSSLRRRIGYSRANAVMACYAARIETTIAGAVIGRIGRSIIEFTFTADHEEQGAALLHKACAAIRAPVDIDSVEFKLSCVIGAVNLGGGFVEDASIDLAVAAVSDAERDHQHVRIVSPATSKPQGGDELTLLREMPEAMRSGALQVHYQPKLRLRTNCIDAAEALIRWQHPTVGNVHIERFIRAVEETGAVQRLTEWVIARAVLDQATLAASGHDLFLWVNLSGLLLTDEVFTARALELMAGSEHRVGFEITETAVIGNPEIALANLTLLRDAGVKIAIDDYGSGLSSLAYLKQLPAQELKIDRLFIKELVNSHRDPLLVRSSIDLAHALEMEVTAEGVDDPIALALLRIMGCDLIQGYIVSPALPIPALRHLLNDHQHLLKLATPQMPSGWAVAAQ